MDKLQNRIRKGDDGGGAGGSDGIAVIQSFVPRCPSIILFASNLGSIFGSTFGSIFGRVVSVGGL